AALRHQRGGSPARREVLPDGVRGVRLPAAGVPLAAVDRAGAGHDQRVRLPGPRLRRGLQSAPRKLIEVRGPPPGPCPGGMGFRPEHVAPPDAGRTQLRLRAPQEMTAEQAYEARFARPRTHILIGVELGQTVSRQPGSGPVPLLPGYRARTAHPIHISWS